MAPLPAVMSTLFCEKPAVPVLIDTGPLLALVLMEPLTVTGLLPFVSVNPAGAMMAPILTMLLLAVPRFSWDAVPVKVAMSVFAVTAPD